MTPCARGCCWTPQGPCAQQRACACHWGDSTPRNEPERGEVKTYRNPTQDRAIRNVMASRNPKRPRR